MLRFAIATNYHLSHYRHSYYVSTEKCIHRQSVTMSSCRFVIIFMYVRLVEKNIIFCFERLIMARLCWKYAAWKWTALSLLFCLMRVSVLVLVKERWASGVAFVLMRPVLGASGVEDPSAYAVCGWSYVCSRSIIVVARQSYFFVWFCRFYRFFEWENAESILSFILVSLSSIKRNVSLSRLDLKGKD